MDPSDDLDGDVLSAAWPYVQPDEHVPCGPDMLVLFDVCS